MPVKVTFRNLNDEVALPLFEPDAQTHGANRKARRHPNPRRPK